MVDINPVAFVDPPRFFELVTGFVPLLSLFDDGGLLLVGFFVLEVVSAGHVGLLVGLLSLNISEPITSRIIARQAAACLIWWTPESRAASSGSFRSNQSSRCRLQAA